MKPLTIPLFAALLAALPCWASPQLRYPTEEGRDEALNLDYEVQRAELSGLADERIQAKLNAELKAIAEGPRADMIQDLRENGPGDVDPDYPSSNGVWVGMEATLATDALLSVSFSVSTYWAGAAHPNHDVGGLVFDLRSGEQVAVDALVDRAKAAKLVARQLQEEYGDMADVFEGRPTPEDITNVTVEPTGLSFVWGAYGLGAPYAMGPVVASLTWAELGDAVDAEGILASAIAAGQSRTVDQGLGGPLGTVPLPEDRLEGYLIAVEDQTRLVALVMPVEDRIALLRHRDAWRAALSPETLLSELRKAGATGLADRTDAALTKARSVYDAEVYANQSEAEALTIRGALADALQDTETGRVVTLGNSLLVRAPSADWGTPFARLPHDSVVGVFTRAGDGLFHTIVLPDGRVGKVHKSYLLIETPVIDDQGRAYRTAEGYAFATPKGLALLPKDGPGHADAELEALTDLVGPDGMSPPVNLIAIEREIGFRAPWLAVLEAKELSDAHQGGEGEPQDGLTDKLPANE